MVNGGTMWLHLYTLLVSDVCEQSATVYPPPFPLSSFEMGSTFGQSAVPFTFYGCVVSSQMLGMASLALSGGQPLALDKKCWGRNRPLYLGKRLYDRRKT